MNVLRFLRQSQWALYTQGFPLDAPLGAPLGVVVAFSLTLLGDLFQKVKDNETEPDLLKEVPSRVRPRQSRPA